MTLSVGTRFEVFKRDRFTCSYCGKHPPDVLLEVDHVVPRAAGGSDSLENLTTACLDCNRGKGARMLEEGIAPVVNRSAIAEMQERIDQAKAYMETLGALRAITDEQVHRVTDGWAEAYGAVTQERSDGAYWVFKPYAGNWPETRSIRRFLRSMTLEQILESIDITRSRIPYPTMDAVRYFYGVCHKTIKDAREPVNTCDGACGYLDGKESGARDENERLRELFINRTAHGYETYADVVAALWPDD